MSPMWVQKCIPLGHLALLSQVHQQKAGSEVEQPRCEPVPVGLQGQHSWSATSRLQPPFELLPTHCCHKAS